MDELFNKLWAKLYDHGASAKKEEGTRRYWAKLSPQQQNQVFTTICRKLEEDRFVQYDPIRAIRENLCKERKLVITADEYYRKYGTQDNHDGWVRTHLKAEQRTVYVKTVSGYGREMVP